MLKSKIEDLCIFGGEPAFLEKLHVGRPNIGNRERFLKRVNDVLDRRWLTNDGPYVQEFERHIVEITGVKHCIATCNGTSALEIAIRGLGLTGEVIVPSFTFIATAHALQWQGIRPVFCDIDPTSFTIDPSQIEKLITPNTAGIIGVHLWGRVCNIERLNDIAQRHNLKLLYDASHAFSCSYKGCMVGNFGNAEVFSFHATKFINTFEGGAIVTNDDDLAYRLRLMKNFGFIGFDKVVEIGTNGKLNEISAAMGLTSLESIDEFTLVNYRNYKEYRQELSNVPGVNVLTFDEDEETNYQYIVLDIDEAITEISRDNLIEILRCENILARRYFYPGCHNMEPYRSNYAIEKKSLPHTEQIMKRVISLPTGTSVKSDDIKKICEIIRFVIENGRVINDKLDKDSNFERGVPISF